MRERTWLICKDLLHSVRISIINCYVDGSLDNHACLMPEGVDPLSFSFAVKSKSPQLSFRYYYTMDSEYECIATVMQQASITKTSSSGQRALVLNFKNPRKSLQTLLWQALHFFVLYILNAIVCLYTLLFNNQINNF